METRAALGAMYIKWPSDAAGHLGKSGEWTNRKDMPTSQAKSVFYVPLIRQKDSRRVIAST